tara:strand:- start:461 stop:607 length:147 start_codon:yes stop_codon:yes gene_type:complete
MKKLLLLALIAYVSVNLSACATTTLTPQEKQEYMQQQMTGYVGLGVGG